MKINKLALDLQRGIWALDLKALNTYAPIAYEIVYGKKEMAEEVNTKAVLSVLDQNYRYVASDENGNLEVPKNSVAIVDVVGVLMKYGGWCSYGAIEIVNALYYADNHPNIVGTVLNVDGPGGSISGIGPFNEFAKRKTKPVVGIADQACSAHLWAMLAVSDYVMADNNVSAALGSIGVMISWVDNRKYLEGLGYEFHEVYPDESEHKNEAFRLAMEGKYDMIKKEMLSPTAVQFQNAVKEARPNLQVKHPGLLTGKTFGADESVELGLIDKVGSMQEAIEMVRVLAEMNKINN